jgi:hypothetical protein
MFDPESRFTSIEDDFHNALATLEAVLKHVDDTKPAPSLRIVILNNVIVALISSTEETLRDLFEEYLTILEESFANHLWLRENLKKANLECAIQLLNEHKRDADFHNAASLVKDLSTCLNGEPSYHLLKDQLTFNRGNFRSGQLTETAKNSGVSKLWSNICECEEVEAYTGESVLDSRVRKLTGAWNSLFDERDVIVHRVSQASGWGAPRILDAMSLSRLVVQRVVSCLVADISNLLEQRDLRVARSSTS